MLKKILRFTTMLLQLSSLLFINNCSAQIAAGFIGDVNIQSHPDVIFAEMFEQSTLAQMKANWTDTSRLSANISFSSNVPLRSMGTKSLKLTTINDGNLPNVTDNEKTYIFKRLNTGITDSVFVRCYIKYNNSTAFHHAGLWLGGNNPSNYRPSLRAGYLPSGDSAFHIGAEVRGTSMSPANNSSFGFYNYWPAMRMSTQINPNTGTPYYWGNVFISSNPLANINMSEWNCIEVMVKLNNPVTSSNGELALWINGTKIAHYGLNFPNGTWNIAQQFVEGTGMPFEGFLWRTNDVLKFNYLWLNNYVTNNEAGHVSDVLYDHIVVAKNYIGPIATAPLPLKFIVYDVQYTIQNSPEPVTKQSVENIWQTANEINVSHFNIQRSIDGKYFETIGKLEAKNNSINEYTFKDEFLKKEKEEIIYYRIEAIDKDGTKTYSTIQKITLNDLNVKQLNVYPNPAKDFVTIETKDAKEILIVDLMGRTIKQFNNITQPQTINIQQLQTGIYFIKVVDKKGNVSVEKLVKE